MLLILLVTWEEVQHNCLWYINTGKCKFVGGVLSKSNRFDPNQKVNKSCKMILQDRITYWGNIHGYWHPACNHTFAITAMILILLIGSIQASNQFYINQFGCENVATSRSERIFHLFATYFPLIMVKNLDLGKEPWSVY